MKEQYQQTRDAVLITGGAKRVGAEIALYLARRGFSIALHYNHSAKDAEGVRRMIEQAGGTCAVFKADLRKESETLKLIPGVLKTFPDLRAVINSASIFTRSSLKEPDLDDLEQNFAIHVKSPYILMSQFAKCVKDGVIINILDTNITKTKISHFNYLLSKKTLASLTGMAAVELAPNIRVNAIAPGLILPPSGKTRAHLDRLARGIPLKRKGSPANISQAVHYLLENDFVTGQTLFVDGGEHLT